MNHIDIWPRLPYYYARPSDARSIHQFLDSYRIELQSVKTAHSKNFLARKGVLLDAAVSEGIEGHRALSRVLQVHPRNIEAALGRRNGDSVVSSTELLERAKWEGVTEYVKEKVQSWWTDQTQVSPNKKDVTRRRI